MNHIKQIVKKLPEYELDAMLVVSAPGERYAVGFQGEGFLLVTREGARYTTDSRYFEAAQKQIAGAEVALATSKNGHLAQAREYIRGRKLEKVGFESGYVTVDAWERYKKELPCELVPAQALLGGLRASKDEEELAVMRRAQEITDAAFQAILNFIRPGMTEREIAARLVYELLRRGGERTSFDPIVAAGPNGSIPHAVPGDRAVEAGSFITMDFGCVVDGYCSDMTRTVALGRPTEEMEVVYDLVLAAQRAGIAAAKAGVPGKEVDAAARQVLAGGGYGEFFTHSFGHSLGVEIHETPSASSSETRPLPAGAVLSAEPGVYIPGRFGVRIEDVLIIREEGCEDITASPKNLIVL